MTTYKLNDYWIYSPQKEQSGVPSIVPYPLDGALLQWIYTELLAEEAKLILMILHGIILASTVISNRFCTINRFETVYVIRENGVWFSTNS